MEPINPQSRSSHDITPATCKATVTEGIELESDEDSEIEPMTRAALCDSKKAPLYPPRRDNKNVRKAGNRYKTCKLCCQKDHNHMQCPHRGPEWSPVYIRQRVAKHSATNPNEKPDANYINQTSSVLAATTKSFAKKAQVQIPTDNEEFLDTVEELVEDDSLDEKIDPEIKMADSLGRP